jgi:mono/diheme cytochrome c family protein
MGFPYTAVSEFRSTPVTMNHGIDERPTVMPDDPAIKEQILSGVLGHLAAWDPVAQEEVWRVQHLGPWNGGILSTAGNLVWQGNAAGFFKAYAADSGEELWASPAQTGIGAAPVTFEVEGEQYVTVVAGWGGAYPLLTGDLASISGKQVNRSRILTYRLGGTASLPPANETEVVQPVPPALKADADVVAHGSDTWVSYCSRCHGGAAVGGGVITDLRYSPHLHSAEGWNQVAGEGALVDQGMIGFSEWISEEDIEGLRQYVIERANVLYTAENPEN